jgi:hypothetical protein
MSPTCTNAETNAAHRPRGDGSGIPWRDRSGGRVEERREDTRDQGSEMKAKQMLKAGGWRLNA